MEKKDLLKQWIQQYYDRLTYVAFTYVRDQRRAEDLVQETTNKLTGVDIETPHVNDPYAPGGVRIPYPDEYPLKRK